MARILVLGGGFGGCAAADELRSLAPDDEVVLVARDDRFVMGFAKLWDLAGQRPLDEGTRSLQELRGTQFVRAEVEAIDPSTCTVATTAGELSADAMLVALGAAANPTHRELLDGPAAHDLYDPAQLPGMRSALGAIERGRVVISILGGPFKCPPAPYEAALVVDRLLRDRGVRRDVEVVLTTPQPMTLPAAGVDASQYVASRLADQDIGLHEQYRVDGSDPSQRTLLFTDRRPNLEYDLLLGVPADAPPPVLATSGLTGDSGWIEPDRHTFLTGYDRVAAVGDCTVVPTATGQLPHAGVFAAAQARVAAHNLVADLNDGQRRSFDGHGYCFLELPGEQVAFVEGNFYADPPDVTLSDADHEQFLRKQAYERDNLAAWFGS